VLLAWSEKNRYIHPMFAFTRNQFVSYLANVLLASLLLRVAR
jgi:hypothetical protein